jgi:hypothetical protein
MREPKDIVDEIETGAALSEGEGERFFGYAVIGLPFDSGHILALRRFPRLLHRPGLHLRLAPGPRRQVDLLSGRAA